MDDQHKSRFIWAALILVACIGCDQLTKNIATRVLADTPPRSYFADTLRLDYELNSGGFLSLGSRLPATWRSLVFITFNGVLMVGIVLCLWRGSDLSRYTFLALVLILAGGLGNLMDRISNQGLVTDFLNVGIGPLRTGIFNIADMAVMAGIFLVIGQSLQTPEIGAERGCTGGGSAT